MPNIIQKSYPLDLKMLSALEYANILPAKDGICWKLVISN